MDISGINYLAVLLAAVAAFVFGAVYYGVLSGPWQAAGRIAPEQARPGVGIMVTTFIAELVMAFILAGLIGTLGFGEITIPGAIVAAVMVWLGFIITTMVVNHRYQNYGWMLTAIDGVHWLGVALIMALVIGWFGSPVMA